MAAGVLLLVALAVFLSLHFFCFLWLMLLLLTYVHAMGGVRARCFAPLLSLLVSSLLASLPSPPSSMSSVRWPV